MATADRLDSAAKANGNGAVHVPKAALNDLGEKIFLDRYALKDMTKRSLAVGDTVIVCIDQKTRQREIGVVKTVMNGRVSVELRDGTTTEQAIEDVDKPLETTPAQMMERVARGIAAIETSPEQRTTWEENFRWLLDDWRFVPGGRILTAAGTDQQLTFFNCMPPEQEILTANGYKPIAEVGIGDLVLTHRNRLRPVLHKFEREAEEPLYIIKPKKLGFDDLRVTGEHKVLAIRSEWVNTHHKSRDGLRLEQEGQWIPAKDLRPGDFLAVAHDGEEPQVEAIYVSEYISGYEVRSGTLYKPQQRSDYHGHLTTGGTHHDVTDRLVVDADLCYLFGRWLGDGNVNHRAQSDIPSGIKIVFGLDEREEAERIAQIIENKFGVATHLKVSSTERWLDLWANSMALGQFFKAFFGCYSYGKRIPQTLSRLPYDLSHALLKGLFTADGYISDNELGIVLSNRALATQVHQQLLRLGYLFSIKENTHRLARRPAYRIQARANECAALFKDFFGMEAAASSIDVKHYFEHDGLRWVRIDEIAVEDYSGIVLDIEVEEDHSFVSAGVVVSNCYVVPSPRDSRRGIVDTLSQMMEIMSRGGGVGINLSSLRPRHAYVKGVNGRSSGSVSWGGLYSFVTGLIEQGGCLTPETLVFTEDGLLRLDEIVVHQEQGWQEQRLTVATDQGERLSRQVFNNGVANVLTVNTDMGLTITGTPNHKVKVMTEFGPAWRRLDNLQPDDMLMVKLGQHTGRLQRLQKPDYVHHNQDVVALPDVLNEELAFFLGYMAGDGFMTTRDGDWRLGLAVAHDSYLINEMPALIQRLFTGVNLRVQQKEHDASLIYLISNRAVKDFLRINGFTKAKSTEVCVPRLIRQSPPEIVGAFLRGLFEADGSPSHGYPSLVSTSRRLIDEVATLLIGLGCPIKIREQPDSEARYGSNPRWSLRVHSFVGLASWQTKVGCDARSRFAVCRDFVPDMTREVSYRLPHPEYWVEPVLAATALPQIDHRATGQRITATDMPLRRKLMRYTRSDRNLTRSAYASLSETHTAFAEHAPPIDDTWFVSVTSVAPAGQALTLDLEVDENHTYLANGLVTHNSRRGALMLILNVWHPDVLSFISAKREAGKITNANISVGLSDDFMDAVHADADWELVFPDPETPGYDDEWDGDINSWRAAGKPITVYKTVKAREIWNSIVESAWSSAEPGLWFNDRSNKMSNSWYFSPLISTNPCHSGRNLVHTRNGLIPIKDLSGTEFEVVSDLRTMYGEGVHYERAVAYPTGVKQLYKVTLDTGHSIELTENHRVFTQRGKVEVKDLQVGVDEIWLQSAPHLDALMAIEDEQMRKGRILGWNAGDGWISQFPEAHQGSGVNVGFIFNQKEELARDYILSYVQETSSSVRAITPRMNQGCWEIQSSNQNLVNILGSYGVMPKQRKRVTPQIFAGPVALRIGFLQGLFSADGSVDCNRGETGSNSVILTSSHKGLAYGVQLLLADLGIKSYVRTRKQKGVSYITKAGEIKISNFNLAYTVRISRDAIHRYQRLIGFPMSPEKQARLEETTTTLKQGKQFKTSPYSAVVSIEPLGEELVYNVTTDISHSLVVNGMVVANCGEQPLPAFGICNLGALNLSRFAYDGQVLWDELRQAVRYGVRFLDNVIDATPYFFDENKTQQGNERRVGLGIMGLADMLIRLGLRYGSDECITFLDRLGEVIATEAYLASADNAAEKGSFPMLDTDKLLQSGYMQKMPAHVVAAVREKGLRNVTLLTVAPTGTTGTMVGTSTGIEPYFSWSYFRKSRLGIHEEKVAIAREWEEANPGKPLPDFFVNAMELSPIEHVNVQAAMQRWIDSAISKTCNVPSEYTVEQTRELYEYMYRLGCKGGTIYRDGSRDEQVLAVKKNELSKEAGATEMAEVKKDAPAPKNPLAALWNMPKIRPRPRIARGATIKKDSPLGKIYVTINDDDEGEPLEIFVTAGKAGSDVTSMADGLGRLASLVLRIASPVTPHERLQEIVNQLKGIGGARSTGFGPNRVRSLPDAVAQALEECCTPANDQVVAEVDDVFAQPAHVPTQVQLALPTIRPDLCPQCGEAAFVHEEGCMHCNACGFSQC